MSIEPYYKNGKLHYKAVKYLGRNKRITKRGFINKTSAKNISQSLGSRYNFCNQQR